MSVSNRAAELFAQQGGSFVEPPVLIEASVPLELSGEAVRNRICTFVDPQGKEWALRPDLTLPIALAELDARREADLGETLRRYKGKVFRLPTVETEPVEYEQVGIERFGAARTIDADVWLFETLTQVCRESGMQSGHICFGDLSVFPAFIDALDFPGDVAAGLKRAFRQAGGVQAYIQGQERNRSGLAGRVAGMSPEDIAAFAEDIFAMTGVRPVGERTTEEIVERLVERSKSGAQFEISDTQASVMDQLLALELPITEAPNALNSIASAAGLSGLSEMLEAFATRAERLAKISRETLSTEAQFATHFGRRFTYYDGLVFEIAADDSQAAMQRPVAAGGRYDSLLSDLSQGAVSATALGGIVSPHRLVRIVGGEL